MYRLILLALSLILLAIAARAEDLLIFDCNNCYSPAAMFEPKETKFLAGGWRYPGEKNDQIWATYCDNTKKIDPCAPPVLAIPHGVYNHVNDPKPVWKPPMTYRGTTYPGYYIVYLTCTEGDGDGDGGHFYDSICASTTYSGHDWSPPQVVLRQAWLPTAVVVQEKNPSGASEEERCGCDPETGSPLMRVRLYANSNKFYGQLVAYDGGITGVSFDPNDKKKFTGVVFADRAYWELNAKAQLTNIDVKWDPRANEWRMLAENDSEPGSDPKSPRSWIDLFGSPDGLNWTIRHPRIITVDGDQYPANTPKQYRVGTAAFLEDQILYASTARGDSQGFKIYARVNP